MEFHRRQGYEMRRAREKESSSLFTHKDIWKQPKKCAIVHVAALFASSGRAGEHAMVGHDKFVLKRAAGEGLPHCRGLLVAQAGANWPAAVGRSP
jgi:hypothetical protein